MKNMIKDALILCAITLVAGLLLGGVYEMTFDARAEQAEKTKNEAFSKVFSEASDFEELNIDDMSKYYDVLKTYDITEKNVVIDGIAKAFNDKKELVGFVVSVTSKEGFGGDISFTVGVKMDGTINGVSILSISETAGLGMNATNDSFLDQYKVSGEGLYIVNKEDGVDGIKVDALTGATITSKAMTKGVNAAIIVAREFIKEVE